MSGTGFHGRARLAAELLLAAVAAAAAAGCAGTKDLHQEPAGGTGGSGAVHVDGAVQDSASGAGGSNDPPVDAGSDQFPQPDAGGSADASPGGLGGASGTGGAAGGCLVRVAPESSPTLDTLEAFPGARARFSASATGARNPPVTFTWTVRLESQQASIATTALDPTSARIEFPVETEGRYQITVQAVGEPTCFSVSSVAIAQRAIFVLRTSADGIPDQDKRIVLSGTDPITAAAIQLDPGIAANILPTRAGDGTALASYVRVTQPASNLRIEGDTTRSALLARVLALASYDLLIVPNQDYAPNLFSGVPGSWPQRLPLDQGTPVTAQLLDGAGRPLAGARMILRRGLLPSTVGTSDASGHLTLWARAGTWDAFIVPPPGSGLPEASTGAGGGTGAGADAGIVLPDSAASLDLRVSWDPVVTAPLSLEIRDTDGVTRVGGARVRATSLAAPVPVATIVAGPAGVAPATLRARGAVDVEVLSDASGMASFAALPVGDLVLTVIPAQVAGGGVPAAAITSIMLTLPAGGLVRSLSLVDKVRLSGTLSPAADAAGARVTAVDQGVTAAGSVATATVGSDGSFSLLVDPVRAYRMFIDPAPGVPRARAVLGVVTSGAGDSAMPARSLPAGRLVRGVVTSSGGLAIGGARIQAFCPVWSARCGDASFSLADAISGADGSFELRVPDPAAN